MIKKEFQKIWANKLLFVTVIVAMCLPILYASIFLKSIWDPYGRINHLPVAVVNLDQPTTLEGSKVDVGDRLVKELKSNDDLDWHFVSAKKAQEGLKDRKYYMIVKIPKNFSENAASVLDTDPEKMDLTYETNGGLNFLGEVISENAMTQLKAKVSESVTKSYADVIIKMVKTVGDGMDQAADGATKLADGSKQVADGIATVQGKVPELSSGVKQLDDGGKQLADGVKQYTDGAGQAAKGSDQLAAGMTQLSSNVPTLLAGGKQLADGTNLLYNQLGAASMTAEQREGLIKYIDGIRQLKATLQELQPLIAASQEINIQPDDIKTLQENIDQLQALLNSEKFKNLKNSASGIMAELQNVMPLMAQVEQQLKSVGEIQTAYSKAVESDTTKNITDVYQTTAGVLQQAGITDPAIYQQLQVQIKNTLVANAQNSQATNLIKGNLTSAVNTMEAVREKVQSLAPKLQALNTDVVPLINQLQPLLTEQNIGKVQQAAAALTKPEVIESVNKVANNPASKEQLKQLPEFINSTDVATAGLEKTVNGIYAISSNYGQVKKLNDGMQTMNKSLPTLAAGVKQLDDGSKQLNAGMKKLTANSAKLNSGASQLSDGLNTLNGQIPALADGVNKLADGSTQVKDGNKELADKLGEASDKLTDVKLTNNTAKMIAAPIKTKQEKYSDVPNYGHALAPYFMSVSLFVGCLVFNFVYPIRKIADRKNSNATQWFMSKLTIGLITSSMMALIIGTVMRMIGLEVAQPMNFYMTLLVTAWLFMFMIMFLAMSFDNPGRFIAVLLLVMQLGSSGGVFPMPLISKFYNVLNPFMPMTYSIYSLRQAISTGLGDEFYRNSMLILVILAIVFIILLGISMQILYRKGLAGYSQLHENQKLLDDDYTGKFAKEEDPYTLW